MTDTKTAVCKMTVEELREFISDRVCDVRGCYNHPWGGYIFCASHMHGPDELAAPEVIKAKKRLERLSQPASDK